MVYNNCSLLHLRSSGTRRSRNHRWWWWYWWVWTFRLLISRHHHYHCVSRIKIFDKSCPQQAGLAILSIHQLTETEVGTPNEFCDFISDIVDAKQQKVKRSLLHLRFHSLKLCL